MLVQLVSILFSPYIINKYLYELSQERNWKNSERELASSYQYKNVASQISAGKTLVFALSLTYLLIEIINLHYYDQDILVFVSLNTRIPTIYWCMWSSNSNAKIVKENVPKMMSGRNHTTPLTLFTYLLTYLLTYFLIHH